MFEYRGFMIDSARHYQSIDEIKEIIRAMAKLNFNKFHWHLTDDQGWRFESEKYPLLNSTAAIRPYSNFGKIRENKPYGRVYTKAEMKDIVDFCKNLEIDVIPEFDIPGHTSALLSAYPIACNGKTVKIKTRQGIYNDILCPANEQTLKIVIDIIDEICSVFPYEYIHLGGDEVPSVQWKNCKECQKLMERLGLSDYSEYQNEFLNKIIDYLEEKGRHCIVWNDTAKGKNLDKRAVIQCWRENDKPSIDFINSGGKALLSPFTYYYMDYDYEITPLNRVYSFNPKLKGLKEEAFKNIIGIETPIWTEYITNKNQMQRLMFPRVIAVSYTALGQNHLPYKQFLKEVKKIQKELEQDDILFENSKKWSYSRFRNATGWLKFVKEHYSLEYIKSSLKKKDDVEL